MDKNEVFPQCNHHPQRAKFSLSNPNFYPTTNQASNENLSIFEKYIGKVSTNPDTALRWWNY